MNHHSYEIQKEQYRMHKELYKVITASSRCLREWIQ